MAAPQTEAKFFTILSSMLGVPREQLDGDSSSETLEQWDSLNHMHLVLALEEGFGIEFDELTAHRQRTAINQDFIRAVNGPSLGMKRNVRLTGVGREGSGGLIIE